MKRLEDYGVGPIEGINTFLSDRRGEAQYAADGRAKDDLKIRGLEGECFEVSGVDWTVGK